LSSIEEVEGVPTANEMTIILTESHERVIRTARDVLKVAQISADESTVSLVSDRMRVHEKIVWMLRAMVKNLTIAFDNQCAKVIRILTNNIISSLAILNLSVFFKPKKRSKKGE
jgi:hypothetical protein